MPDQSAIRAEFEALYDASARAVLAFAVRRTPTVADAEDVATETFVVAWRKFKQVPAGEDALPWLYGVARRLIGNQRRASERRRRLQARLAEQPQPPQDLRESPAESIALAALERLRSDDQELLKLLAWEDLSHAEIATVLGISPNAVAIRLHRARRRYKDALEAQMSGDEAKGFGPRRTLAAVRARMFGPTGRNEAR